MRNSERAKAVNHTEFELSLPPCAVCGREVEIDPPRGAGWYAHVECGAGLDLSPIVADTLKKAFDELRRRPGVEFYVIERFKDSPVTLHVMPAPAKREAQGPGAGSGLDEITFALDPNGGTLAKSVVAGQVLRAHHLLRYRYAVEPVSSLEDLLRAVEEGAAAGAFALRGRPLAPVGRRALKDDPIKGPAGLEAVPRRHAALDWEGFMLPGIDPLDGAAVARALLPYLPPEMARADLGWQLTAGAGIKEGIRARTWHFLDRALSAEELKVWLAPLFRGEEPMIDPSTLLDVQPIYLGVTGGPQVQRFGILRGQTSTVAVPAIDLPEARRRARRARKEVKAAAERTQAARAGRLRNRNAAPRMRRLVHQCLVAIRAARGQEGQRLAVFKHQAARARRLAEMGGMSLAHVDDMLLRAGTYLYEGDQERIERNIVPLLAWLRGGS